MNKQITYENYIYYIMLKILYNLFINYFGNDDNRVNGTRNIIDQFYH